MDTHADKVETKEKSKLIFTSSIPKNQFYRKHPKSFKNFLSKIKKKSELHDGTSRRVNDRSST